MLDRLSDLPPAGLRTGLDRLSSSRLFHSVDLDETRERVGQVMKPHRLTVVGRSQHLNSTMDHIAFGEVSLSRLRYGADVEIQPGRLDDFFLVQMPLSGRARIQCGKQTIDSSPAMASVLNPCDDTTMRWMADSDQMLLRISRSLVERTLSVHLGRPLQDAIRFGVGFHWCASAVWMNLLTYLLTCATQGRELWPHRLVVSHVEQLVAATLLSVQPHSYSQSAPARGGPVLPRHVRKARDYLDSHAHESIRVEQLAQLTGVSVRSLYAGFKAFSGVSPMQYLKQLRLERARAELLAGASNVSAVALQWGFGHLGRFSSDYRARFGETPSESLRQGRDG